MSTSPPAPPPLPAEDLPSATHAARGCLFVSGCGGSFILLLIMFILAWQAASFLESWVTREPFRVPRVDLQPGPLTWAWWILSWAAFRGMQNRIQKPWVYWTAAVSLAGWCWFAFVNNTISITHGGTAHPTEERIGSWIATTLAGLVFLHFTFSRQNRVYFRVMKSGM